MKSRITSIVVLAVVIALMIFVSTASAVPAAKASILYTETELGGSLWKYDYIFQNDTVAEHLYGVRLYFGDSYDISSPSLPAQWKGAWGMKSHTSFMEAHTYDPAHDIAPKDQKDGFSFTIDYQVRDISYDAYFYDSEGTTSSVGGTTAPVVPEPVSSVLFITGGMALAFRKRFRRKK